MRDGRWRRRRALTRPLSRNAQLTEDAVIKLLASAVSYLQVAPLLLVLLAFFGIPLLMIVGVSFFEFDGISSVPAFQFGNYTDLFTSRTHADLYLKTVEYALIVWAITLVVGFTRIVFPGVPCAQHSCGRWRCFCSAPCRSGPLTSSA